MLVVRFFNLGNSPDNKCCATGDEEGFYKGGGRGHLFKTLKAVKYIFIASHSSKNVLF